MPSSFEGSQTMWFARPVDSMPDVFPLMTSSGGDKPPERAELKVGMNAVLLASVQTTLGARSASGSQTRESSGA
jgi:hypothetical protein